MSKARPRIALIHALMESIAPIHAAFAKVWPQAFTFDLLDNSLSRDLAIAGTLTASIIDRFLDLGRYAATSEGEGGSTCAILFTCSAFGPAIEAVQRDLTIPVLKPNEAAFEQAISTGKRIGLLVSFAPSQSALENELQAIARQREAAISIESHTVEGALSALKDGDVVTHDALIAEQAAKMTSIDTLVLGQFSMARAAPMIEPISGRKIVTTPEAVVARLRDTITAT